MTEAAPQQTGAARTRLGAALRELLDVVVRADGPDAVFDDAARKVDELRSQLAALGQAPEQMLDFSAIRRDMSLVGGRAHPVGPQIEFAATEHGSVGTTTVGAVFEGGPGLVHGGVLALLLDHAMGHAAVCAGYAAMTTELTLRFRRPTRLGRQLHVTARLDRKAGRMLYLSGEITVDGTISVEASGMFITLTGANVASIFGEAATSGDVPADAPRHAAGSSAPAAGAPAPMTYPGPADPTAAAVHRHAGEQRAGRESGGRPATSSR